MARVLRLDQLPKSATQYGADGADTMLEDFDTPGTRDSRSSKNGNGPSESSPEETLSKDIIKSAEYQAEEIVLRAKHQFEKAKAEAEQLIAQAQTEAARVREQAQSEGYQQGITQGKTTIIEERRAEIDHLAQALQGFIDEIPVFTDRLIAQHEAEILELVLVISTKVVGFELSVNPDIILEVVKHGVEMLKDKREISIRLNPGDLELVRKHRPELLKQVEGIGQIYLTADENLIIGECLIENRSNLVDSTWRRKISNAAEVVWELYNKRAAAGQGETNDATPTH